jgi:hypothetical protein
MLGNARLGQGSSLAKSCSSARAGNPLDLHRFEVTALAINWTALIVAGVLLSVYFGTPSARHTPTTSYL